MKQGKKRSEYRAAINWLTKYKPLPEASNLEKVKGLLESFSHLCEVEDWERCWKVLHLQLNTPIKDKLHNQLGTWGYYDNQITLYNKILDKLSFELNQDLLIYLATYYLNSGKYYEALKISEITLQTATEINNERLKSSSLLNLGTSYCGLKDYQEAIDYLKESLLLARKLEERHIELRALVNLGKAYSGIINTGGEINYYEQGLIIARELKAYKVEFTILFNLAETYQSLGNSLLWEKSRLKYYAQATDCLIQALELAKKIEYKTGETLCFQNLK